MKLGDIASQFDLELRGDPDVDISGVCTLEHGRSDALSFLSNPQYRQRLPATAAGAVILSESDAPACPSNALIAANPYLAYARVAAALVPEPSPPAGVHAAAVVDPCAEIGDAVSIDATAVVGAGARIGARSAIGAGAVIEPGVEIGADGRIGPRAVIHRGVRIGRGARIHAGAVIGSRGFGLAPGPDGWIDIPQLGGVLIGDDVEVGANTTIDRGAVEDTVLEDGVKLDNQVQIAHNCRIGARTAIAGATGLAGSVQIGARCLIGGGCCLSGHIVVCDDVNITGMSMVTRNIAEPGLYSSGWPATDNASWRKQVARLRRLDKLDARLKALETRDKDAE